jgi:L-ribulose-5-phosphate 3-epimerase
MRTVTPMEIGLMFWADQSAEAVLGKLNELEIHAGQLGAPPEMDCDASLNDWANGLKQSQFTVTSAVCCYKGEDYSTLETVHETVGFTTAALRADRIVRTQQVSEFARALGITALSCHIGFIPSDPGEALYAELRDLTRVLCDYCAKNGQNFVLETGQESAEVLLAFIHNLDRKNLKVNFDPANMIMYKAGDPLAALKLLSPHVLSVHCKDARSPVAGNGFLGAECALGDGEVDFPGFLKLLKEMNYQNLLTIEREEQNAEKRFADIKTGKARLTQWKADLGL